jgi:hypothetical protein
VASQAKPGERLVEQCGDARQRATALNGVPAAGSPVRVPLTLSTPVTTEVVRWLSVPAKGGTVPVAFLTCLVTGSDASAGAATTGATSEGAAV